MVAPYQPTQIDLPGIFMAAQQYKHRQQQMEMERARFDMDQQAAKSERERAAAIGKAQSDFLSGADPEGRTYQQLDYGGYSKIMSDRAAQQKAQAEAQTQRLDLGQKRQDNTARLYTTMIEQVQKNPEQVAQYQDTINKLAEGGQIDHFWIPTPEELPQAQQRLGVMRAAGTPQTDKQTSLMQNVVAATGFQPGTPQFQAAMQKAMEDEAKKGSVNVTLPGNAEASGGTRKAQEEELLGAYDGLEMLGEMDRIAVNPTTGKTDYSQFLGLGARGKKFLLSNLDEIDPSLVPDNQRAWLDAMSRFRTIVDEYKAGRYNKLLGSAQSASEVRNLANAVLNADMGSTQFVAAKQRMEQVLARKIQVAEQVLGEGIPLGSLSYRKRFAEIEGRGRGPQNATPQDTEKLFSTLIDQGMTRDQAFEEIQRRSGGR